MALEESVIMGERSLEELGGATVVSACLNRRQRIGGWDSIAREPLPLRSFLPAGSVLFCEFPKGDESPIASDDEVVRLGKRTEWGFGLMTIGVWPDRDTRK